MKNFDMFFKKLVDIKESWEIFRVFEEEREKFAKEAEEYHRDLQESQELLRVCRNQIHEDKSELEKLKKQIQAQEKALKLLKEKRLKCRVKTKVDEIQEEKKILNQKRKEILPQPISEVEVFTENGEIKSLKASRRLYNEELFSQYRITMKENRIFRNRVSELELENAQLKIELRDLQREIALQERLECVEQNKEDK